MTRAFERADPSIIGNDYLIRTRPQLITVELRERDAARKQYAAVMRFTLQDEQQRLFNAERMCYLGSVDDWIPIRVAQPLAKLARALIPTLGTEAFFGLY